MEYFMESQSVIFIEILKVFHDIEFNLRQVKLCS